MILSSSLIGRMYMAMIIYRCRLSATTKGEALIRSLLTIE